MRIAVYETLKRAMDVAVSFAGLVLLSPLFLVIAALVKLSSPGPALYRGVRTGQNGREFRMAKFRTMCVGADKGPGSTAKDDPRVTRVGHFLRRHKLDELPQLLNVLVGDMSLVGPRPELPRYTNLYTGDELLILTVRPGITDFSSLEFIRHEEVLGKENPDEMFKERILPTKNRLRVKYVRERGFLVDLRLIVQTLVRMLR
jgi:lipopolysaccharide/colanic/teichoic acid biosynthesis glycosyltransferase